MLIGIDGRSFTGHAAGTARYIAGLCRVLDDALPKAHFAVFSNVPITLPVDGPRWSVVEDPKGWGAKLSPFEWYMLRAGALAGQYGVDVFWGGANFLPLRLPRQVRAVITVHDVVHRIFPRSMTRKHRLAYQTLFRPSLRRADVVLSNSAGTSMRLREFGYRPADMVVRPAASGLFVPPAMQDIVRMREQLGIPGAYLVSVSTLEPRKNLDGLVEAYRQMCESGELVGISLVLVGQSGWKNGRLNTAIAAPKDSVASIHLTGYVPEELLPSLYAAAEAVVMPSIYEGFGMPVLEARLCGARIVATDLPETREAGGDQVIYVPPTVEGIQAGIRAARTGARCNPRCADVPRWEQEGLKLARVLAG
ncbi:glycosyltransferase family 4 protein [Paraburkholderia sp. BR10954]|uniref:glycosyltransferase family 4 protein n=1 Tax=Paraburkholderia sp. BR10954 TaxID=3236995 RepID=UPI0034D1C1B3